jgi:plasmid stabilization system protein ParE
VPKRRRPYVLTETAARDFREARRWSQARWGDRTTRSYFQKLHDGAEYVAAHQSAIASRDELTGDTNLGVYPVGEHFLVYVPIDKTQIAIVALVRQIRDVPALLQANHFQIQRALNDALKEFAAVVFKA